VQLERTVGSQVRAVRVYGSGEFIGGLTLLGETRRLYSLRALETTTCLVLNREKFTKTLEQFPGQTARIFKAVVGAINRWEEIFLEELTDECGKCIPRLGVSLI
jgi:CRP-like cAMP-binding protein